MNVKIGIITHYNKFQGEFSHLAERLNCHLVFNIGVMEYAITLAQQMEEDDHVEAIIAHEKTSEIIRSKVSIPVIPIHIRDSNLFNAFYKCHQIGDKIAFVDLEKGTPYYDFEHIKTVLGYDISRYTFNEIDEVNAVILQVIKDGCDVIATTASCTYRMAKKLNIHVVLIEHCEEELITAIEQAKSILSMKSKEEHKLRWLSTILDNTEDGFITANQNFIITSANAAIQRILRCTAQELVGKPLSVLSTINSSFEKVVSGTNDIEIIGNDTMELVVNRRSILSGNAYLGSVIKVTILKDLQRLEMQARKKISATGFVANHTFTDIVGNSQTIKNVIEYAKKYALSNSHILVTGESGTGKEMFAQGIHNYSHWRDGPFIAINCATLPENLLDSELFGYEDGAFTGAKKGGKAGLFELAHGGTLFLDEVGEMPIFLQAKLLRVLQDKVVRRLGGVKNSPVNVRIILATNRNLYDEVLSGAFRKDLYYRVNVLNLTVPPLRHRKQDIAHIACSLAKDICASTSNRNFHFTPSQLEQLQQYNWPGNVRELHNFVERIIALTSSTTPSNSLFMQMMDSLIRESCQNSASSQTAVPGLPEESLTIPITNMREMENHIIRHLYHQHNGNKKELGYILGISDTTLWRRLKEVLPEDNQLHAQ